MKRRAAIYLFGLIFAVLLVTVLVVQDKRFEARVCKEIEARAGAALAAVVKIDHIQIRLLALQPRVELYEIEVFPKEPGKYGVAEEPSFQAQSAKVVVRPIQLWARQLDIDRIEVEAPHLDLTQKNGKWVGLPAGLFIPSTGDAGAAQPNALSYRLDAFLVKNGILHLSGETNDLQLGLTGIDALGTIEGNGNVVVDVSADGRRVMMKVGEDWFEEFVDSVDGELVIGESGLEIRGSRIETESLSVQLDGTIGLGGKTDVQLSRLRAVAPLEFVQRMAPSTPSMLGELDWTGSVVVNEKGFRAKGLATVDDFWLERFHFGATEVDLEATSAGVSARRARFDGAGGKVEGPLEITWPDNQVAISADLGLSDVSFARVLDMVGVVGSHVDTRVDGKVQFSGGVSPLSITGTAELAHADFAWRDKAWNESGEVRPYLRLPEGTISGGFGVTPEGIELEQIASTAGSMGVTVDGAVFFRGATDLSFSAAPLALGEISPVGPIAIAGTGPVSGRIAGAFDSLVLESNLDLEGMKVAGFDFGHAKGPLKFDIGSLTLSSERMEFVRGKSSYGGSWAFGITSPPTLEFSADVGENARIEDLADIVFADLKASQHAQGTISKGHIELKGPLDSLSGRFDARGTNLRVAGEPFSTFRANGRWREGAIVLDDLVTAKASGAQLFARGSLGPAPEGNADGLGGTVNLEAHTSRWSLSDLGSLAVDDSTFSSTLAVRLHLGGRFYRPELNGRLDLGDTLLYGQPIGASQVDFKTIAAGPDGPKNVLSVEGALAGATVKPLARVQLVSTSTLPYTADVVVTRHNLKPYFMAFNPRIAKDPDVKASLAKAVVKLSGDLMQARESKVDVIAEAISFQRGQHNQLFNKDPIVLSFGPGPRYDLTRIHLVGNDDLTDFRLSGGRNGDMIDVKGQGQLDLAFAELATDKFTRVEGVLDVKRFWVKGNAWGTDYGGDADIVGGTFKTRFFPIGPEDVFAHVVIKDRKIEIQKMKGKLGGGTFSADTSTVALSDEPDCAVKTWDLGPFELDGVNMRFPSYAFGGRVSGPIRFVGSGCSTRNLPVIDGDLVMEEARFTGPINWKASTVALKAGATEVLVASEDAPTFRLDVKLNADGNVWVRNDLGNIEFKIDPQNPLTVTGDNTAWGIVGSLNLVRGKILLQSKEFTLTKADINFDNSRTVDFTYEIIADTLVREWQITFRAEGRRSRGQPQFKTESVPPLPPEDINLLLLIGVTSQEAKASGQDAALIGAFVGTTLGQGLGEQRGVTSRIKKALNLDSFDLVPSYTDGGAIGIKAVGRSTVNDDFSVNYSVGQSDRVTGTVQGDYRLSRRIHIVGGWSNEEQRTTGQAQQEALSEQGDVSVDARFRFEWK